MPQTPLQVVEVVPLACSGRSVDPLCGRQEIWIRSGCTIAGMPNIATILRGELCRVARKEARGETLALKKAVGVYRAEIAALKRRTQALEQQMRRLSKITAKGAPAAENEVSSDAHRFSANGLSSQRRRLGLSARDCGFLVGASAQSVYNWEEGKARPRAKHLAAIASLRTLGKREARARLGLDPVPQTGGDLILKSDR